MVKLNLSQAELKRYSRHFALPNFGIEGQKKLKAARVLCVGAGGLGSPLMFYLAAAGVGTIGVIDPDHVETSNLHRQILYTENDKGQPKVAIAKKRLLVLNPHINIETYAEPLTKDNAISIIKKYDVVADGTDNFPTRFLVNDACVALNKPNVYASIFQFEGQLSVFNAKNGPCYRCLYPSAPPNGLIPNCAEGGVLGVLPGIMGSLQATEVIKLITNIGESLIGRLLTLDALTMNFKSFAIEKNQYCELCSGKVDFYSIQRPEQICAANAINEKSVAEITPEELQALRSVEEDFVLLDVRQPFEFEVSNLGGKLIPLAELSERLDELNPNKLIIVHCKAGVRGQKAVRLLQQQGFNAKNLRGGILAWSREIDPSILEY